MNVNQRCDSLNHEGILPAVELTKAHVRSRRQRQRRKAVHRRKDSILDSSASEQCSAAMATMELDQVAASLRYFDVFVRQQECHSANRKIQRAKNGQAFVVLDCEWPTNEGLLARMAHHRRQGLASKLTKL